MRQATLEEQLEQARARADRAVATAEERTAGAAQERAAATAELDEVKKTYRDLLSSYHKIEDRLALNKVAAEQAGQLRAELEGSRRADQELAQRLYELEHDLQAATADLASSQGLGDRFAAEKADWEKQRQVLMQELALWREKSSQGLPKLLELERARDLAEEATAEANALIERHAARFEAQRRAWQQERQELLTQLQALSSPVLGPKDP